MKTEEQFQDDVTTEEKTKQATSSSSSDPLVQQELDKVLQLPGQTFNISFAHYAGYVTVNKYTGRALFYWLIEAAEDPSSKPLVLWLNGGRLLANTLVIIFVTIILCVDF
ncbi:Serine carboxypeptidase-like 29 [Vitis vinifera]|uniref:Serine carboxypeptidase-like 29 n=1 Tax=Vitis vinifera TaxID=29760 RepID=A0A438CD16_VITVI|nr:Serine carboxypeptidase-like 29 [Vitis vinifera]